MPELPEVETVATGLRSMLTGDTVSAVRVLREESIALPSPGAFCKSLVGHRIESVGRRGKYLLIELSGEAWLVAHLRMSGRLIVRNRKPIDDRFLRVNISFESGRELHFEDMRVFGRLWYLAGGIDPEQAISGIASLGVEPLDGLTVDHLSTVFARKKQPVKSALLDQRIIAGIGNIYADESLFLAGINPATSAGKLSRKRLSRLVDTIGEVLRQAIEKGGSTLRDYQTASGINGDYQNDAWVYGREKELCRSCKSKIKRIKLAGRSTHFCPRCQRQ